MGVVCRNIFDLGVRRLFYSREPFHTHWQHWTFLHFCVIKDQFWSELAGFPVSLNQIVDTSLPPVINLLSIIDTIELVNALYNQLVKRQ